MTRELNKASIPWVINTGNKYYDYENKKWFNVTPNFVGIPVRVVLLDTQKITLYKDTYYKGNSVRLEKGEYIGDTLKTLGLFKNTRSLMIPFDFEITVYDEDNFTGKSRAITQTLSTFDDSEFASMSVNYLDSY